MASVLTFELVETSVLRLPDGGDLRRLPRRPVAEQGENFDAKFDAATVFTDVFQVDDEICFTGPPVQNLMSDLLSASWSVDGERVSAPRLADISLTQQSGLKIDRPVSSLQLKIRELEYDVPVRRSYREVFAGRKVLVTMSKDNPLIWIKDWIIFHMQNHGTNAVLIYDNGSKSYSAEELLQSLREVPGLEVGLVIRWDLPYGPGPSLAGAWDANFLQITSLQHAKLRFLAEAGGVIQGDIDELVVTHDGKSIYDHASESESGICVYQGRIVEAYTDDQPTGGGAVRHRDFKYIDPTRPLCAPKWTLDPRKVDVDSQWHVHSVSGNSGLYPGALHRHLLGINTGWKYSYAPGERREGHEVDNDLVHALSKAADVGSIPGSPEKAAENLKNRDHDEATAKYDRASDWVHVGVGAKLAPGGALWASESREIFIGELTNIYRNFEIMGPVTIGSRSFINRDAYIRSHVTIGNEVSIGPFVRLITDSHEIGASSHRAGKNKADPIHIGDGCWVGAGATILGGVHVGRGSVVAAGSVVVSDVPENVLVAGVPARIVRTLDA